MRTQGTSIRAIAVAIVTAAVGIVASSEAPRAQAPQTTEAQEGQTEAEVPTFYRDALPALTRNCVACHRDDAPNLGGMVAPMSLVTYQEVRPWARRIAAVIEDASMPPWDAHEQHKGQFKDERYISEEDRATLIAWARGGAPMGSPADAPSKEQLTAGLVTAEPVEAPDGSMWWMGVPDLVVEFEEPVPICNALEDWQPTVPLLVPDGALAEPKWIRGMEIQAGSSIVHHTVSSHLGVGTPGRGPFVFPEGWGILLTEDPYITINMHYHKNPGPGTALEDDTKGGFLFYEDGDVIDYIVETDIQALWDFEIPPGESNWEVTNQTHFDEDIYLLSVGPHAHYRGKAVRIELERPDRRFRETILDVPDYDFNWQFQYELNEPYLIPAGSTMHITWWYDNSPANRYNPDPTATVSFGAATTDEMMNARIYFARAKPAGLVVGEAPPADLLERTLAAEERARERDRERGLLAPDPACVQEVTGQ